MNSFKRYILERKDPAVIIPKKREEDSSDSASRENLEKAVKNSSLKSQWMQTPSHGPVSNVFGSGITNTLDAAVSPSMMRWDKPPTPQEFNKNRNMASGPDYLRFPDEYEFLKDTEVSSEGEPSLNPNRLRRKR